MVTSPMVLGADQPRDEVSVDRGSRSRVVLANRLAREVCQEEVVTRQREPEGFAQPRNEEKLAKGNPLGASPSALRCSTPRFRELAGLDHPFGIGSIQPFRSNGDKPDSMQA